MWDIETLGTGGYDESVSEESKPCQDAEQPSKGVPLRRDVGRRSTNFSKAAAASKTAAERESAASPPKKLPPRPGRVAPETEVPEHEVLNAQQYRKP
jgi:hypothetical protein